MALRLTAESALGESVSGFAARTRSRHFPNRERDRLAYPARGGAAVPDWIYAVILGVVEGLTEFIPVSSTGHLLLTRMLLGLPPGFWDTFVVLIQLGAILAVVFLYFQKLWAALIGIPCCSTAPGSSVSR
jgi:hypothetical protein